MTSNVRTCVWANKPFWLPNIWYNLQPLITLTRCKITNKTCNNSPRSSFHDCLTIVYDFFCFSKANLHGWILKWLSTYVETHKHKVSPSVGTKRQHGSFDPSTSFTKCGLCFWIFQLLTPRSFFSILIVIFSNCWKIINVALLGIFVSCSRWGFWEMQFKRIRNWDTNNFKRKWKVSRNLFDSCEWFC